MKTKQQRDPTYSIDPLGNRLAHISMANTDRKAVIYAEDFARLMAAGFSRCWKFNQNGHGNGYPTLNAFSPEGFNREVMVARLVAEAPRGWCVSTRDGDSLNLRRDNLEFKRGAVWYGAADWSPTADALRCAGGAPVPKSTRFDRRTRRVKHLLRAFGPSGGRAEIGVSLEASQ